jgi:hydroxyacylglutathione hydrolase
VTADLTVIPIPCLKDNYAYLVFEPRGDGRCLVVDASETEPVREEIRKRGLELRAILTTHHHWDHIGGNLMLSEGRGIEVIAHHSEKERIPAFTRGVTHGETFSVLGIPISVLHNPGHTQGGVTFRMFERSFVGDGNDLTSPQTREAQSP